MLFCGCTKTIYTPVLLLQGGTFLELASLYGVWVSYSDSPTAITIYLVLLGALGVSFIVNGSLALSNFSTLAKLWNENPSQV